MPDDKSKPKKPREKPLTLFPLTMDEALKRALDTPPPPKAEKKPDSKHTPKK
jgi:hypothetical protein